MTAVDLIDVHHEGAGAPHDDPGEAGTKGYSVWIGPARYTMLRPPRDSFATLHFNHVSFDICYSGDRTVHPLTSTEIELVRAACADGRSRGWVTDTPYVRPHRESPGSATICPSNNVAYADPPRFPAGNPYAWYMTVAACHKGAPPMPPTVAPEFFPALQIVSVCTFHHPKLGAAVAMLDASGAVFCEPPNAYMGGANGHQYFVGRTGAEIVASSAGGYVTVATSGEKYGPDYGAAK